MRPILVSLIVCIVAAIDHPALAQSSGHLPDITAPTWLKEHRFGLEEFTFVRVQFSSLRARRGFRDSNWATDYPHADLNLSAYLARLTSLAVAPQPKVLKLTDENLSKYPFIYLIEPGRMVLEAAELEAYASILPAAVF